MADVEPNTEDQRAALKAMEDQAELEKTWPLYTVVLTGDEVEWEARPGVNLDDEGNPQPWNEVARCAVQLRAPSEDWAKMRALQHNPQYHTVESVELQEDL